jgi:hypothetical protein
MTYFTRSAIGLRARNGGPGALTRSEVDGIALHWPGGKSPIRGVANVKAALRAWQRDHMDRQGWSDIGYQEAVDQDGNVYELRGLTIQSGANGGTDVNERFGAVLLVLAIGEEPTRAMIGAVRGRIARHRAIFPNSRRIVGHQDVRPEPTACPGPAVMRLIRAGEFDPAKRPPPKPKPTRGEAFDRALAWLRRAKPSSPRRKAARQSAIDAIKSLPTWRPKS